MTEAEHSNTRSASSASGGCGGGAADHGHHAHHSHHSHHGHQPAGHDATKVIDPVCGMTVDPATSQHRFDYRGKTFHFCSAGCRTKFAADPQKHLDKREPKEIAPEGTIYTCP